jgi:hypothetical protein
MPCLLPGVYGARPGQASRSSTGVGLPAVTNTDSTSYRPDWPVLGSNPQQNPLALARGTLAVFW